MKNLEPIEKYLANPSATSLIVLCHKNGTIDARKKIIAKAQAVGVVFESKKLKDYQLPSFIEGYLKTRKAAIENKAGMMIAEAVGADFCGVDILYMDGEPVVCEVNSNAHMRNLLNCTGIDVSDMILEHIIGRL